jgi:hypothetical protein
VVKIGCNIASAIGGISASDIHTSNVVSDIYGAGLTPPDYVNLINTCNTGSAGVLTSLYVFDDFYDFETRVGAGLASLTYLRSSINGLRALGLYGNASLVTPCVAGDAGNLYTFRPG